MTGLENIRQSLNKLFKIEKTYHDKTLIWRDYKDEYMKLMCSINLLCIIKTYLENDISWDDAMYKTDYYCTDVTISQESMCTRNKKGELVRQIWSVYELGEVRKVGFDTFKNLYVRKSEKQ